MAKHLIFAGLLLALFALTSGQERIPNSQAPYTPFEYESVEGIHVRSLATASDTFVKLRKAYTELVGLYRDLVSQDCYYPNYNNYNERPNYYRPYRFGRK